MKYAVIAAVAAVAAAAPADWEPAPTTSCTTTTTSAEWEAYTSTTSCTTSSSEWEGYTTTTPAWAPYPTTTKCSSVSTYTTKECKEGDWANCYDVTKYSTVYPTYCPTTPVKVTETWAPYVPVPTTKCSSVSTYTTKECKSGDWANCYDVTKYSTVYPTVCPTTYTSTWAVYSSSATPVKASTSTWAAYSSVAATSTYKAPVATWTGAADKSTFGMGALAIAAVAALL